MSRKLTNYRLNGKPSTSIRVRNKQVSAKLPDSNSAFCQSVYDFVKLLIDNELPRSLLDRQKEITRGQGRHSPDNNTAIFTTFDSQTYEPKYSGKKKAISTKYKLIFLDDLNQFHLTYNNFDYTQDISDSWNTFFINRVCKHWINAESQDAFSSYGISTADFSPENLYGVISRWFDGKRAEIQKKTPIDPRKKNLWRKSWYARNALKKRRVSSLNSLGISAECCEPFEEPLCHSDSEELPDKTVLKVGLQWRSPVFAALCEVADRVTVGATCPASIRSSAPNRRLIETRRRPAQRMNIEAKVPMNLVSDAYCAKFLKSLPEPEQKALTNKPPSGLAEFYFKLTREHPNLFTSTQLNLSNL
ncbi:hypothetical protein PGT21_019844 [Puccinia graminis f. sp. tritici]|uniref:Uncharacterized protein n=2 Tax=Puccinia graminis f. sp. tritici TaxID=56615 RepID=E3LAF2_PUCGT|nr:uncharacterized protein PGTG_18941 [Puccinia graminis f. sp. tritici CRL 75-36-700-3]EFP93527.2 hypothetical protein PGTG_18941 [Puccinia graminis f. sp. tritici CRL 75-36-700-3]KAA1087023.1 hypothetical protein PGT21_019844 [Puccinia graminis f. sp. tritici]